MFQFKNQNVILISTQVMNHDVFVAALLLLKYHTICTHAIKKIVDVHSY